jgi:cyclic-di-GMP phosphodiesterase TipF (flagellum assembly factor)
MPADVGRQWLNLPCPMTGPEMMRLLFLIPALAAAIAALAGYGLSGSALLRGHLLGVTGIAIIALCAGFSALLAVSAVSTLRLSRRFEQLRADLADYEFAVGLRLSRLETDQVRERQPRPDDLPASETLPVDAVPAGPAVAQRESAEAEEKGNVVSLETAQRERAQQERRLKPRSQETDKAIADGRFEAWFQPVVSLPLRKTSYLLAVPHLPVSRGGALPHGEWSRAAARLGRASAVDQQMLLQGIKLVRDLRRKEKPCAVIWQASRATLQDAQRFQEVLDLLRANSALRDLIVCEIAFSDYRQLKAVETERLFGLREAGCRLCLGGCTDLAAMTKALRTGVFGLAAVEARAIIDGAASDIATSGLEPGTEIIATGVSSEADAIALIDFEIGLALGPLFSPPRPLKRDLGASGAP